MATMSQKAELDDLRAHGLDDDEINEMRRAFESCDVDNTGQITIKNLSEFFKLHHVSHIDEDLKFVISHFVHGDVTGGKTVKSVGFVQFAKTLHQKMRATADPFDDAFDMFNKSKSGKLTEGEMKDALTCLHEKVVDVELGMLIKSGGTKPMFKKSMDREVISMNQREIGGAIPPPVNVVGGAPPPPSGPPPPAAAAPAPAPAAPKKKIGDNPRYHKYFKLLSLHMPIYGVKAKMQMNDPDLDPDLLDDGPDQPDPG